jgi:hypothetical protein
MEELLEYHLRPGVGWIEGTYTTPPSPPCEIVNPPKDRVLTVETHMHTPSRGGEVTWHSSELWRSATVKPAEIANPLQQFPLDEKIASDLAAWLKEQAKRLAEFAAIARRTSS